MSTHESRASSTSDALHPEAASAQGTNGVVRERRRRWWLGRIEGAPLLRHLSLLWKLLIIVVVLLIPTGLLLFEYFGKSGEEIVRMRRELCVVNYTQQLRRVLSQQIALGTGAGLLQSEDADRGSSLAAATALAEMEKLSTSGCGLQSF